MGLITLSENPMFPTSYIYLFGGMMLIGLVIPLELMAIYYKLKN